MTLSWRFPTLQSHENSGNSGWFRLDLLYWLGLVMLAVGAAGMLYFVLHVFQAVRESKKRKTPSPSYSLSFPSPSILSPASFALFFLGVALLGAFAYSYSETTKYVQSSVELKGDAQPSSQAFSENYTVLDSRTEVFTRQVSPVRCEGVRDLVYWRELRVYNATKIGADGKPKKIYLTTFTLTIENKGTQSVSNVLVTEHIPDIVAAEPGQVFNFTVKPVNVRKGSVVVEWMFDKVDAGEKKTVSYSVEKRVDADALKDFSAPNVVAQAVKQGAATVEAASTVPVVTVAAQRAGVDWTVPGIVVLMAFVGAGVYFVSRKTRVPQA